MKISAVLIFCTCCLVLVISVLGIASEMMTLSERRQASEINAGRPLSQEGIDEAVVSLQKAGRFSLYARSLKKSAITFKLYQYDQLAGSASFASVQERLRQDLIKDLESYLSKAPASSNHWLLLGLLQAQASQSPQNITSYLERSYWTGPYEGWISGKRLKLASLGWPSLDQDQKAYVIKDIRALLPVDFSQSLQDAYRFANPELKTIILQEVDRKNTEHAKWQAKKLRSLY